MDTAAGVIGVAVVAALIVGGLFIRYLQSRRVDVGIRAKNIISRQGGVIAEDGTGRGVDISDVNAAADVRLSSSNLQYLNPTNPSATVSQIDADQLVAGRDITFLQQSGQFYLTPQHNDAKPRVSRDDISALLTKLHSNSISLSQCLAECFSLAIRLRNKPFEDFCRQELEGWSLSGTSFRRGQEHPEHRTAKGYISYAQVNLSYMGWRHISDVFEHMDEDEHFQTVKVFVPFPISDVEALAEKHARQEGVIIEQERAGKILRNAANPDAIVYRYWPSNTYEKVIRAIRNEVNSRLLKLIQEVKD